MKNVALIITYAKNENEETSMKEVSAECKRQGCLDQNNLAAAIKSDTSNFQIYGDGQNRRLKITVRGKKTAEEILDAALEEENEE